MQSGALTSLATVLNLLALLVQKYKNEKAQLGGLGAVWGAHIYGNGTQFTCFTSTKVQKKQAQSGALTSLATVLNLLALLSQKYKY